MYDSVSFPTIDERNADKKHIINTHTINALKLVFLGALLVNGLEDVVCKMINKVKKIKTKCNMIRDVYLFICTKA